MTGINDECAKPEEMSALDQEDKALTKDEHIVNFVKVLSEIDKAMEPFREHRSDMKKSYQENKWLSKEDMTLAARAYRSLKNDEDLEEVLEYVNKLKNKI